MPGGSTGSGQVDGKRADEREAGRRRGGTGPPQPSSSSSLETVSDHPVTATQGIPIASTG